MCNGTAFTDGKNTAGAGLEPGAARSAGQRLTYRPGRVAQSVGHLTRKSEVLDSIPGLATYFRFSFR